MVTYCSGIAQSSYREPKYIYRFRIKYILMQQVLIANYRVNDSGPMRKFSNSFRKFENKGVAP